MPLEVRRYRHEDDQAIERLNKRLAEGGSHHRVYPEPPAAAEADRRHRVFVAAEPPELRGGASLIEQSFRVNGSDIRAGWLKYPVAESLVNPKHSGVAASLIFQLLRQQQCLMALGLGGHSGPLARLLAGMKWSGTTVPFYFLPVRPGAVLRNLCYIRSTPARRLVLDGIAATGLGWLAQRVAGSIRAPLAGRALRQIEVTEVTGFGEWADRLWRDHRDEYSFVALRDSSTLNALYPPTFEGLTRLRLSSQGEDIGWAVVLRMDLRSAGDNRYFGPLIVGVVADGFAAPRRAKAVVAAATRTLKSQGVDLLISNQSHPEWRKALRIQGFYQGPSNFAFYRSPLMEQKLTAGAVPGLSPLLNRGDCDGPKWI